MNLRRLIDERCDGVAANLARRLGMQPSYLSRLFSDNPSHLRMIGTGMARRIEQEFGLPDGWLDSSHAATPVTGNIAPLNLTLTTIPGGTAEDGVTGVVVSEAWMYQHLGVARPQDVSILTASGDAMNNTLADGDVLFIDRAHDTVRADAIYALVIDGDIWVRRVQRRPDGSITLIPDNRAYEPHTLTREQRDSMKVIGRVVGAWRWAKL